MAMKQSADLHAAQLHAVSRVDFRMASASSHERLCGGAPEVVLHEQVVVREGLRHLQERDQVTRLLPHLPADSSKTLLSDAAQE